MIFKKIFFKLMNNTVSGKTIEIMRKHRDIKFVTTEKKRNYSVPEPNCHTTKYFTENVSAIDIISNKYL